MILGRGCVATSAAAGADVAVGDDELVWSAMTFHVGRLSPDPFLAGMGSTALRSFIMNEVGIS